MSEIKLPRYDGELPTMVVSGFIGAVLAGKLIEQHSAVYCPEEISEIINFYLEKAYNKGVEDMRASAQDLLFEVQSNNYEYSLDYSYNHFKRDKENDQRKREKSE